MFHNKRKLNFFENQSMKQKKQKYLSKIKEGLEEDLSKDLEEYKNSHKKQLSDSEQEIPDEDTQQQAEQIQEESEERSSQRSEEEDEVFIEKNISQAGQEKPKKQLYITAEERNAKQRKTVHEAKEEKQKSTDEAEDELTEDLSQDLEEKNELSRKKQLSDAEQEISDEDMRQQTEKSQEEYKNKMQLCIDIAKEAKINSGQKKSNREKEEKNLTEDKEGIDEETNLWQIENGEPLFVNYLQSYLGNGECDKSGKGKLTVIMDYLNHPGARQGLLTNTINDGRNILEILVTKFTNPEEFEDSNIRFWQIAEKILNIAPKLFDVQLLHKILKDHNITLEFVKKFLTYVKGKNLNIVNPDTEETSLEAIYYSGRQEPLDEIVKILLEKGANPFRVYEKKGDLEQEEMSFMHILMQQKNHSMSRVILEHLERERREREGEEDSDSNEDITPEEGEEEEDEEEDEEEEVEEDDGEKELEFEPLQDAITLHSQKKEKKEEKEKKIELDVDVLKGASPLHYAVKNNDIGGVRLLSAYPKLINLMSKNSQGIIAENTASSEEIKEFLHNKRLEGNELNKKNSHWVRSLDFEYHKIDHPPIIIEGEMSHMMLMAQEMVSRAKEKKGEKYPNYATAGITFVLEDKSNENEILEKFIPITSEHLHVSEIEDDDSLEYSRYLASLHLPSKQYHINKKEKCTALSSEKIKRLYSENRVNFKFLFHHSEQAIFWSLHKVKFLEEIVNNLIDTLLKFEIQKYKVVAIILNIYSQRYMCENCQNVGNSEKWLAGFKELLIKELKEKGFKIKNNLSFTIAVSSTQPYGKIKKSDKYRQKAEDHQDIVINLRSLPDRHIFFKDFGSIKPKFFSFTSRAERSDHRVFLLQKKLAQSEKKCRELEEENQNLKKKDVMIAQAIQRSGGSPIFGQKHRSSKAVPIERSKPTALVTRRGMGGRGVNS